MVDIIWDFIAWLFIGPWWMLGTAVMLVVIGLGMDEADKRGGS